MEIDFEKIKKLNEEKRKLLEAKPELQALQNEIDEALKKCGNDKNNRMVIIHSMMLDKFRELNDKLQEIKSVIKV